MQLAQVVDDMGEEVAVEMEQRPSSAAALPRTTSAASVVVETCHTPSASLGQKKGNVAEVSESSSSYGQMWQSIGAGISLASSYTKADVRRRPKNCCLGFTAVFLVVFFTGLVLAAISKTNYLILRFAELSVGEMDAAIYATNGVPVVNFTRVSEHLQVNASHVVSGSAPRWLAKGTLRSWREVLARRNSAAQSGTEVNLTGVPFLSMNLLVVDSELEPQVGIGRAWPYRRIGYGEFQATDTALSFVNVHPNIGDRASVTIDLEALLSQQSLVLPNTITSPSTLINVTSQQAAALELVLPLFTNLTATTVPAGIAANTTELNISGVTFSTPALLQPQLDMNAADAISEPDGKYPSSLGNTMVLDYHELVQLLLDQSCANGPSTLTSSGGSATSVIPSPLQVSGLAVLLQSLRIEDYSLVIVAMFQDRFTTYYKDYDGITNDMITRSNAVMLALDYRFPGKVSYPLALLMTGFSQFNSILTSVFVATVIVILVIGAVLVYTLLGLNGEERQYELAMIRALGMSKRQLLLVMMGEVLIFTIPGVIAGVLLLLAVNAVLEKVLSDFNVTPYDPFRLPVGSTIFAIIAGFLLPVVSNWTPVGEALQASLRDALDVNRQAWNETKVTMIKLAELGLEMWQTLLGVFLVVAGFVVYYLIPLSFLFTNFSMFFTLMNLILLVMLFGLCLLASMTEDVLQRAWLWCLLWGNDRRLITLIRKNMDAHQTKNSRAFMMFVICTACVIFGGLAFDMLSNTLTGLVELQTGADVFVTSLSFDAPLDRVTLDGFLANRSTQYVSSWAYATFALSAYPQVTSTTTRLKNILGTTRRIPLVALTPTYLDTALTEYVSIAKLQPGAHFGTSATGVVDVVRSLYLDAGSSATVEARVVYSGFPANVSKPDAIEKAKHVIPILAAASIEPVLGISVQSFGSLTFTYQLANGFSQNTEFLVEPRALLNGFPGYAGITPQRFLIAAGTMFVSESNFEKLLVANSTDFAGLPPTEQTMLVNDAVTEVRYEKLFIRLQPGLPKADRAFFLNSLQSQLNPYFSTSISLIDTEANVQQVANLLYAFYYFSAVVSVVLASLMTWIVFISNVTQNAWALGVLRSLGFTQAQVLRSVMFEALALILAAFTMGLPIGLFVGYTAELQIIIFLNLPMRFAIPYPILLVLLGVSLLAATLGSWLPLRPLNAMPVAAVLKKYN